MAELNTYGVGVNGYTTTLGLSDADAKRRGLDKPVERKAGRAPANKAKAPTANKAAPAPENKAAE